MPLPKRNISCFCGLIVNHKTDVQPQSFPSNYSLFLHTMKFFHLKRFAMYCSYTFARHLCCRCVFLTKGFTTYHLCSSTEFRGPGYMWKVIGNNFSTDLKGAVKGMRMCKDNKVSNYVGFTYIIDVKSPNFIFLDDVG